jgi:D-beta-D-heptose 7-phosphate kinase/D-beta-D-heptose 1-phosphate adenosyltransferase
MQNFLFMVPIKNLRSLIHRFANTTVLVVGDVMIDEYIWGKVTRISPEAPVPILDVVSESQRLGGAANVIHNLHALGGTPLLCSVIGDDSNGEILSDTLQAIGVEPAGLMIDPARPTTIKTRVIAHHQQVARLDRESREDISGAMTKHMIETITGLLPRVDAILIEDYGKGVVTSELVQAIVSLAQQHGKIVAVDPKTNHFRRYTGVSVLTPNHHEAGASLHTTINTHADLLSAGKQLLDNLGSAYVLITRGEEGMSLFERHTHMVTHVPTMAQEVYDVTGAGDTVIAALTLGLAAGGDPVDAVLVSNAAAGVVVGKVGTATVDRQELEREFDKMTRREIEIRRESFD